MDDVRSVPAYADATKDPWPPQTGTALLLIAAFVLPGFVALLMRERTYWVRGEDTPFERLLHALYYSSLVYGFIGVGALAVGFDTADVSSLYRGKEALGAYVAFGALALFVLPFIVAEIGRRNIAVCCFE